MLRRLSFSLWYLRNPPWDTGISPPELQEFIKTHSVGRALDLGCGTGTNVITLAKNGWETTGVDFSPVAIRKARKKAQQAGVNMTFHVQDASRLAGIQGPFDLVLDIGCLHGLPYQDKQAYIRDLPSLLAPQGTYLLYAFVIDSIAAGMGLTPEDLDGLATHLELVDRKDGTERGRHPSAWFTYQQFGGKER